MGWLDDVATRFGTDISQVPKDAHCAAPADVTTPVDYDDALHSYTLNKHKYTSASGIAERFHESFPADAHIKYAAKHGNTPEYWKAKWAEKNLISRVRGNRIHDANETTLHARMIDIFEGQQLPVIGQTVTEDVPWITRPDGVYTEQKLWHHGYRLAGRVDKVILLTPRAHNPWEEMENRMLYGPAKRYAHIDDYKTNEKLDFKSYQYKNGSYKMMRVPVAHLMDCNWIHYCIQQSAYMLMLEYQGFLPGTMTITHYPHSTEEEPNPKKIKYTVPYMKKEVVNMCNFLLK